MSSSSADPFVSCGARGGVTCRGASSVEYTVVIPVFNEEGNVEALTSRVVSVMQRLGAPFELLFVDDGSRDRTPEVLRRVAAGDPRVRVIRFTRNYGQEAAVEALYLHARGRWLIQMDGDLQHPPEEIPALVARRDEGGYDVVYGVRQARRDALFRVFASRVMQWSMRSLMEIELPDDVSTFRLMDARIARLVAALPERRKFFSALLVWSGARVGTVRVRHEPRHTGSTHYNFTKLLNHTFDLIVGFSSKPLRYIGALGFAFAVVGLALGAWVIARKLLWDYGIMGWPSLFAAVVILGGVQLIATSVIGEYIARIYVQAQARPLYNVAERLNFDAPAASDTPGEGHDAEGPRADDALWPTRTAAGKRATS
ncbi:MAG TPA: glycosyltransferase family 2 protein [Polyangiaceae bacterium]|nr:glycosyltransferase family 2 protein [Polyangiaceae bacterium]